MYGLDVNVKTPQSVCGKHSHFGKVTRVNKKTFEVTCETKTDTGNFKYTLSVDIRNSDYYSFY